MKDTRRKFYKAKPQATTNLLEQTFRRFGIAAKMQKYAFLQHWPEIIGTQLAAIAIPERIIRNRIIVIRVLDPNWAQELTLMKSEILKRIEALPDAPMIEDIRFVVGGPRNKQELSALKLGNSKE